MPAVSSADSISRATRADEDADDELAAEQRQRDRAAIVGSAGRIGARMVASSSARGRARAAGESAAARRDRRNPAAASAPSRCGEDQHDGEEIRRQKLGRAFRSSTGHPEMMRSNRLSVKARQRRQHERQEEHHGEGGWRPSSARRSGSFPGFASAPGRSEMARPTTSASSMIGPPSFSETMMASRAMPIASADVICWNLACRQIGILMMS